MFLNNLNPTKTWMFQINFFLLLYCKEEEIKKIISISRRNWSEKIENKEERVESLTSAVVITFDSPVFPKKVKLGYLLLAAKLDIQSPLRCFKYLIYAYTSATCTRESYMRLLWRGLRHESECSNPLKYVNCTKLILTTSDCRVHNSSQTQSSSKTLRISDRYLALWSSANNQTKIENLGQYNNIR